MLNYYAILAKGGFKNLFEKVEPWEENNEHWILSLFKEQNGPEGVKCHICKGARAPFVPW